MKSETPIRTKRRLRVLIDWKDANHRSGWKHDHDEHEVAQCRTVGWVMRKDDSSVVVAQTRSTDDDGPFADAIAIPTKTITRMRRLKQ